MKWADLHIHTTCSDGRMTPTEIVDHAIEQGLAAIAITDHDALDGFLAVQAYRNDQIQVIPGIELSTDYKQREVHILGYAFDVHHPALQQQLQILIKDRLVRVEKMVTKLWALGYVITLDRVCELANGNVAIGRPHVARALVEKKYFATVGEVFEQLLSVNGPAYVPHYKLHPQEAVNLIHAAQGLAVLAHPGLIQSEEVVADLIGFGINGLEAYHPQHDPQQMQYYSDLAKQQGLFITGGSDFHAIAHRFPSQLGQITIPAQWVSRLLEASNKS